MVVCLISVIISFLLESFASSYIAYTFPNMSLFCTIYSLVSLVIIYPYFSKKGKYLVIYFCTSIFFDLVFSNIALINIFIFIILYFIIKYLDYILPHNMGNSIIKSLIIVFTYNILSFIILNVTMYDKYSIMVLIRVLYSNIIMTIVYSIITYLFVNTLFNKFSLKKVK